MKQPAIFAGIIYRFKRGYTYSSDPNYNCFISPEDWEDSWECADVWICNEDGEIDPEEPCPRPILRESISSPIKRYERGE